MRRTLKIIYNVTLGKQNGIGMSHDTRQRQVAFFFVLSRLPDVSRVLSQCARTAKWYLWKVNTSVSDTAGSFLFRPSIV